MTDNNPAKKSNGRIFFVYLLLILFGMLSLGKILSLGIKDRAYYMGTDKERCLDKTTDDWKSNPLAKDSSCNCVVTQNSKKPRRGDIYDDQGRILAGTISVYDITIDGRAFKRSKNNNIYRENPEKLDALIRELSHLFYQQFRNKFPRNSEQYYRNKIEEILKGGENIQILRSNLNNEKEWITKDDVNAIRQFPLLNESYLVSGLNLSEQMVRMNPYGEMAKRAIGREINGKWDGLEYEFNPYLYGVDGSNNVVEINGIRIPLNDKIDPVDGCHLNTTINLEMQSIVHNELLSVLKEYKAEWGCAVVMETRTGEVKAISNLTRTDSNRLNYTEQTNYVINYMLEPGSTFKLASLLAFLERTQDDSARKYPILSHSFTVTNASGRESRYTKKDEPGRSEEAAYPIEIFQRSSNVGIASMIFDRFDNYKDFLSKIDSMDITTTFSTQLGKVKAPNIKRNAKDFHNYYNTCYGTAFKMAPIQTLIYFNAVANDGKMIVPLFVKSIMKNNEIVEEYKAEVINEQICEPQTIARAKEYLHAVVEGQYGTARRFKDKNFSFAGKTGTRDIWDEKIGGYNRDHNCVSFCGYFPADQPKYTCVIYIYDVPKKSTIAVGAFAKMAKNILNVTNYDALRVVDQQQTKNLPRFNVVQTAQLERILSGIGLEEKYAFVETPYASTAVTQNREREIKPYLLPGENTIPNVKNMLASDAIAELSRAGYNVQIIGKGVVKEQKYSKSNHTITLSLGP